MFRYSTLLCILFLFTLGSQAFATPHPPPSTLPSGEERLVYSPYLSPKHIARDILARLEVEEYNKVNDYFMSLVTTKPMELSGTRLLESLYDLLAKEGSEELLSKWIAKEATHAALIARGIHRIKKAWSFRGGDWGYTISEERRRLMHENLAKAQEDLTQAYQLNADDPNSSAHMIVICVGKGLPEAEMNKWFNRAIHADASALTAYKRKFMYLSPVWYGSQEQLKTYAEHCQQNSPMGSSVYSIVLNYFYYTAREIAESGSSAKRYLEQPDVKATLQDTFARIDKEFPFSNRLKSLRASLWFYLDEEKKALDTLHDILHDDPEYVQAYHKRGRFYHQSGMLDEAEADYRKLISLTPDDAEVYSQLGLIVYRNNKNLEQATQYLGKAIALKPHSKRYPLSRGFLYKDNNEHSKAVSDFTSTLAIDPYNESALLGRSASYEALGEYDKAIEDLLAVKELQNDGSPMIEYRLNRLLEKKTNPSQKEVTPKTASSAPAVAERLSPHELQSLARLGEGYYYRQKTKEAKEVFKKILKENPKNDNANFMLGQIAAKLEHNYKDALKHYSRALTVAPHNEKYLFARGVANYMTRNYAQAIDDLTKLLESNPKNGQALYYRGLCFDERGLLEEAIKDMQLATLYAPDYSSMADEFLKKHQKPEIPFQVDPLQELQMLAEQNMMARRYDKAEEQWKEILTDNPEYDYALFRLGILTIERDRNHAKAISYFRQATAINDKAGDYHYNLAMALKYLERLDEALASADNLLKVKPKYGTGYRLRAELHEKTGNYPAAVEDYKKAKKYKPGLTKYVEEKLAVIAAKTGETDTASLQNADFLIHRSDAYLRENEFNLAINDLKAALELEPENEKAYYKMGRIYSDTFKDYDKAIRFFNESIQRNASNPDYRKQRGFAHYHKKEWTAARDDFSSYLERRPNDGRIYYYRGMCNKKLGDKEQARDDLIKAEELDPSWAGAVQGALSEMM